MNQKETQDLGRILNVKLKTGLSSVVLFSLYLSLVDISYLKVFYFLFEKIQMIVTEEDLFMILMTLLSDRD